jgi:integrase
VALFTGMRLGEVLALREGRVDLDKGVIEVREALEETKTYGVRFKTAKTKAGRRNITLPTIAVEALRDHRKHLLETRLLLGQGRLAPDDLLFANLEGPTASAQCRIIRLGRPRRAHRHTRHHVSRPSAYPRLAVDRRQC